MWNKFKINNKNTRTTQVIYLSLKWAKGGLEILYNNNGLGIGPLLWKYSNMIC